MITTAQATPIPSAPSCPRCQTSMTADTREPILRTGARLTFPALLPSWRCSSCGIERPRFED